MVGTLHNPSCIKRENCIVDKKMLCWVDLRYPNVTIDGDRKFLMEKPEKFSFCIQYFYLH